MPLNHTVYEVELKTGAKGLIVEVPGSTVVSSTIHFRAGNDYAKRPEIHQVAHLMEHMAFGPNAEFETMESFSQAFSKNGAYSNASTFDTNMHYYADCAQFEWERILRLQALATTRPTFSPEILNSEKGNVNEELTGQAHNNPRVLWQAVGRAMGSHSLLDKEKIATVEAVTTGDIREHHKRTHTHKNLRFVLAGNFGDKGAAALEVLENWSLPTGERLDPIADKLHSAPPVSIVRQDQATITFGLVIVIPRILSPRELLVGSALNQILTGTLHSRIWGKARTRGICYGMGSNMGADLNGSSSWEFFGQVRPENAEQLFQLIVTELKRVLAGEISADELTAVQQFLTGDYQMRGQTVSSLAGWYGSDYFFDDKFERLESTAEHIATISVADMVSLAKEFVAANTWTMGEIGSVEARATDEHHAVMSTLFH